MSGELKVHFVEGREVLNIKKWVNFSVLLKEQIIIKALYYQGACANRRSALMMEKMLEEKRRDEFARQERKNFCLNRFNDKRCDIKHCYIISRFCYRLYHLLYIKLFFGAYGKDSL
ncbi:hypothetical protein [Bartonella sp. MM73XJBT.G]|uniref:hypothetical protein n=1 Tax=Bartonella sp. MM73XJBT.G TaxID=3019097 RepID=UPI00235F90D6|nr:hypothetical protein [Bartonella sp. MM73XJBT.G]